MKEYSAYEIMMKFNQCKIEKQNKILKKALDMALEGRAGTKEYAIAMCMGYRLEDNGSYVYVGS
jgi:hypothetical protein